MKSWVSSPPARGMHKGVNGFWSANTTVRTRLSVRSRAPSTYSSPRSSRAAIVSAQIMPRSATTQTRPMPKRRRRRSMTGTSTLTSAVLPGHISEQNRPACGVDHHAYDHLHQVGAVVLGVAPLAQGLPAHAGKRQRGRVHEHHREFAEQVALSLEQALLNQVLDRAGGKGCSAVLLVRGQFLTEPGHSAVEMMEGQAVHVGDVIVGQPLLAGPV